MTPQGLRILLYCLAIFVLMIFSAFFSLVDSTYSTVNILRLEKAKSRKESHAAEALCYAENYDKTITTVLFGNNLANILMSSLITLVGEELFAINGYMGSAALSSTMMSLYLLLAMLLFCEIMPKVLGKIYSYRLAKLSAPILHFFEIIFFPVVYLTTRFANWIASLLIRNHKSEGPSTSDEELEEMVKTIEEEGIIDSEQSKLLHNSIIFKDTTAEEIMTPRVAVSGISYTASLTDYFNDEKMMSFSRIIVYKKNYDHIVGYIPTKSLLKARLKGENPSIPSLMLPILSVPSTIEISSILRLMKKSHHHIAVVKDEYGGTAGILTLEDILEELVGELYDESEHVEPFVQPTARRNVYLVQGKMDIDDFFERFSLDSDFIEEDYNTLSGWINDKMGRFAIEGDKFSYEKIDVEVVEATPYTVSIAEVSYHPRRKPKP